MESNGCEIHIFLIVVLITFTTTLSNFRWYKDVIKHNTCWQIVLGSHFYYV